MSLHKALKKKITGAVSDVISAPARMYHGARGKRFEREANVLRKARKYDNAASFTGEGKPSDAFKMRTVADSIRSKYTK